MIIFENFLTLIKSVFINGVFGLSLGELAFIFIAFVLALLVRGLIAKFIVKKVKLIVQKTTNSIDDKLFDSLIPPIKLLPIVIVFLVITLYFDVDSTLGLYFQKINNTLSTIFVFWLIHQAVIPFSNFFYKLEDILSKALVLWIIRSLRYLIIFLGSVAVLDVWGIKIGPVIAGLGLFGVAVALGAQDLFKNLISGIMILLEKRFHIGDVINVPGHTEGTVEHIGFRSTLIRKFDSTPITIPNYIFAEAPILNYSNRINRRINWIIGLEYNSKLDQIKNFTKSIDKYINESPDFVVNQNFKSFVRIDKFNDSSIDILIYCFTSTNEWDTFLKIKEQLAMKVKGEVEKEGLNFAFPSQSIYIEKAE
ncbi:mechanosensitive ion channel family protein [Alphaproteobacteria bacterium]|jgi:MscS family membrane protein|nr:mechanosensitive ion channel family protein [Alphaproteobacteria bacterium]